MNRTGSGGNDLVTQIALLPTPNATDHKGTNNPLGTRPACNDDLSARLERVNGKNTGMKLHSDFVGYLMGYPLDWLDV
jgi:hypothetical protein